MFIGDFTLRVLGGEAVIAEFAVAVGASCVTLAVFFCLSVLRNIPPAVAN
jgi:hypothetical protein